MKYQFADILNVDEERRKVGQNFPNTDLHKNKTASVV